MRSDPVLSLGEFWAQRGKFLGFFSRDEDGIARRSEKVYIRAMTRPRGEGSEFQMVVERLSKAHDLENPTPGQLAFLYRAYQLMRKRTTRNSELFITPSGDRKFDFEMQFL